MIKRKPSEKKNESSSRFSGLKQFFASNATHFVLGLIVLVITIYAFIAMLSFFYTGAADQGKIDGLSLLYFGNVEGITNWTGMRGAILSDLLMNKGFGVSTFFLLLFLALVGLRLMKVKYVSLIRYFIICSFLTIWTSVTLAFSLGKFFKDTAYYIGGSHGFVLSELMVSNFGRIGTLMIIIVVLILILAIISSRTIPFIQKLFRRKPKEKKEEPKEKKSFLKNIFKRKPKKGKAPLPTDGDPERTGNKGTKKPEIIDDGFTVIVPDPEKEEEISLTIVQPSPDSHKKTVREEGENDAWEELDLYDPTLDLSSYQKPSLDLLKRYDQGATQVDMEEQNENKNKIIQTLENFGISIKSIKATVGPTVTLYEIVPEDGVRITKIRNLEDDIAMNLAALGIRIIAPMPGKGTVGIEVPNKDPQIVSMYSIIASRKYQETNFELPIALGRTITNEVFMVDLTKAPHLLVAGATGQGKSVGLNVAITSLLYKKHPAELKFVLIDPKMVEFGIYSVIEKHFLAKLPDAEKPIITDFTKVIYTLNSLTKEMDDRYSLLEKAGSLRNIKEYNEKFIKRLLNPQKGHRFLPYIVVIIDEFGDLIMTAGKEIEQPIARIAQKARAVGIHMIIATQRPTTNIITGTIKANFPARIAFKVISIIDSRTILDTQGANQLVGRGDMLYTQGNDMTRIQCAFIDTPEVERISKFISGQQGYPIAHPLPEYTEEGNGKQSNADLSDLDPLFEDSARLIVTHQSGSTSLIQRKFGVGYNRAGRIMDQLEIAGIVGPTQGSKPREVYIQDEYRIEQKLQSLKE